MLCGASHFFEDDGDNVHNCALSQAFGIPRSISEAINLDEYANKFELFKCQKGKKIDWMPSYQTSGINILGSFTYGWHLPIYTCGHEKQYQTDLTILILQAPFLSAWNFLALKLVTCVAEIKRDCGLMFILLKVKKYSSSQ